MDEQRASRKASVTIDLSSSMDLKEDNLKNVGCAVLKELYKQLELDKFWKGILKKTSIQYDLEAAFRLLVFSRILNPASRLDTFNNKGIYFEDIDGFALNDVYKALDLFDQYNGELQKWIYKHSSAICERDMSISCFDCTNYYFDIGRSDMDTFDDDGRPVDKKGNPAEIKYRKRRPEKVHMRPIINRVKSQFESGRVIFVADRGLNISDNIYFLNGDNKADYNPRDGYVYGQSVCGADAEFKVAHPKKYDKVTAAGSGACVQNIAFDKSTGEIVEGRTFCHMLYCTCADPSFSDEAGKQVSCWKND